jgi:hypothetical protein
MGRKRFILVVVILLIGAGLWGWIAFNAGSEWPPAFLRDLQPKAGTSASASSVDSSQNWSAEWQGYVDGQGKAWGDILVKGCDAGMSDFEAGRLDTDGDGISDKVCWRTIQTGKYGDFIGVAVIAKAKDGTRRSGYAVMPAGGNQPIEDAFSGTDNVKFSQKVWPESEFSGKGTWANDPVEPPVSIVVTRNGETSYLFWPRGAKGEMIPLVQTTLFD